MGRVVEKGRQGWPAPASWRASVAPSALLAVLPAPATRLHYIWGAT